jgi:hypothetical protein
LPAEHKTAIRSAIPKVDELTGQFINLLSFPRSEHLIHIPFTPPSHPSPKISPIEALHFATSEKEMAEVFG